MTERLVAGVYHRRRTTPSRAEWLGATCSRHDEETDDECVGLNLKQGTFPKHDHHQRFDSDGSKITDQSGKVDILTNSSCDGVDYE